MKKPNRKKKHYKSWTFYHGRRKLKGNWSIDYSGTMGSYFGLEAEEEIAKDLIKNIEASKL